MMNEIYCSTCSHTEVCKFKESFDTLWDDLFEVFNKNELKDMIKVELVCKNYRKTEPYIKDPVWRDHLLAPNTNPLIVT